MLLLLDALQERWAQPVALSGGEWTPEVVAALPAPRHLEVRGSSARETFSPAEHSQNDRIPLVTLESNLENLLASCYEPRQLSECGASGAPS